MTQNTKWDYFMTLIHRFLWMQRHMSGSTKMYKYFITEIEKKNHALLRVENRNTLSI